jgi:hypothetical protein
MTNPTSIPVNISDIASIAQCAPVMLGRHIFRLTNSAGDAVTVRVIPMSRDFMGKVVSAQYEVTDNPARSVDGFIPMRWVTPTTQSSRAVGRWIAKRLAALALELA